MVHLARPSQSLRRALAEANVAHLAGVDELLHGADHGLNGHFAADSVAVVQVNVVGSKTLEGFLNRFLDVFGLVADDVGAVGGALAKGELGGEEYLDVFV
jgi:hypothetical protein